MKTQLYETWQRILEIPKKLIEHSKDSLLELYFLQRDFNICLEKGVPDEILDTLH